jgi:hypothetical protein
MEIANNFETKNNFWHSTLKTSLQIQLQQIRPKMIFNISLLDLSDQQHLQTYLSFSEDSKLKNCNADFCLQKIVK